MNSTEESIFSNIKWEWEEKVDVRLPKFRMNLPIEATEKLRNLGTVFQMVVFFKDFCEIYIGSHKF